jgi:UbiD family decarboxylase
MTGGVAPGEHVRVIFDKWKALGKDMPFALAIGTEPVIPFVGGMPIAANVNEADFIGGYLGEPVDVVACETVPLDVPATAEIIIEGTISIKETALEGPMGDYSGFLDVGAGGLNPIFHVSAITHRHDPILPVVSAGEPIEENHTCWGVAISSQVLWELRQKGFPVTMCFAPFQGAVHTLVITVPRSAVAATTHEKLVKDLAALLFHCRAGNVIPKVVLATDDIDPTNVEEVFWALSTMCHPVRDQYLFANEDIMPMVGYLEPQERKTCRGAKMIYCCLPPEHPPTGRERIRSSFRYLWPSEIQERVVANWKDYGYTE